MPGRATIRPARPGEAAALTRLAIRSKEYWGYDEAFMLRAAPDLTIDPHSIDAGLVLVAQDETGPVGVAGLERESGAVFDVAVFFIAPERIGSGLGRQLFAALVELARNEGGEAAGLLTILSDPNAEGFYQRMGAVRVGEKLSIMGRMLPLLHFRL